MGPKAQRAACLAQNISLPTRKLWAASQGTEPLMRGFAQARLGTGTLAQGVLGRWRPLGGWCTAPGRVRELLHAGVKTRTSFCFPEDNWRENISASLPVPQRTENCAAPYFICGVPSNAQFAHSLSQDSSHFSAESQAALGAVGTSQRLLLRTLRAGAASHVPEEGGLQRGAPWPGSAAAPQEPLLLVSKGKQRREGGPVTAATASRRDTARCHPGFDLCRLQER